ncbi:MAG: DsrE family protein [Chitinophagaceae bacterium]|nr:DsrE family protein [Chitinophagaceae bacterium]
MKKYIMITALFTLASSFLMAQDRPYNVVFDLTSGDTAEHQTVIRWINLILQGHPDAKLEVVFYGKSLGMVTKDRSVVADGITKLTASNKNVSFKVCSIAMKRHKIEKDQLLPGVMTVPDGIYEIISKQAEGWGYIKVVH